MSRTFKILTLLALSTAAIITPAQADEFVSPAVKGLSIDQTSRTKMLAPVAKIDTDTGIYTDTSDLEVPVDFSAIQRANNLQSYTAPMAQPVLTITAPDGQSISADQIEVKPLNGNAMAMPPRVEVRHSGSMAVNNTTPMAKNMVPADVPPAYRPPIASNTKNVVEMNTNVDTMANVPTILAHDHLPVPNDPTSAMMNAHTASAPLVAPQPDAMPYAENTATINNAYSGAGEYVVEIKTPNDPIRFENDPNIYVPQKQVKVLTQDAMGQPIIMDAKQYDKQHGARIATPSHMVDDKFAEYDSNENGLISKDEFITYEASIYADGDFMKLDANADGYLERREFSGERAAHARRKNTAQGTEKIIWNEG